jgi:hypothetical protein
MALEDFRAAALLLRRKNVVGATTEVLGRVMRMLAVVDRPLLAGLHDGNGKWMVIIGGWYEADRAVILCQMNDEASVLLPAKTGHLS